MGINDRFGGTSYTKKKKKRIFPPSRSRWSGIVVVLPLYLFSFWRARTSRRYYFNTHNVDGDRIKSSSFFKITTAVASQPACGATTMIEPVKTSLWPAVHAHELSSDGGAGVRAMDLIRYVIISKREGNLSRRRCGDDGLSEAAGGDETRKRHRRKDSVREGECRGKGKFSTASRMVLRRCTTATGFSGCYNKPPSSSSSGRQQRCSSYHILLRHRRDGRGPREDICVQALCKTVRLKGIYGRNACLITIPVARRAVKIVNYRGQFFNYDCSVRMTFTAINIRTRNARRKIVFSIRKRSCLGFGRVGEGGSMKNSRRAKLLRYDLVDHVGRK